MARVLVLVVVVARALVQVLEMVLVETTLVYFRSELLNFQLQRYM